jgi:hypothetical protein
MSQSEMLTCDILARPLEEAGIEAVVEEGAGEGVSCRGGGSDGCAQHCCSWAAQLLANSTRLHVSQRISLSPSLSSSPSGSPMSSTGLISVRFVSVMVLCTSNSLSVCKGLVCN